jgi:hypothetical protein
VRPEESAPVEISISILKDASEALKVAVEALEKVMTFLRRQATDGWEFLDRRRAQDVSDQLHDLTMKIAFLVAGKIVVGSDISSFANDPTVANWNAMQSKIVALASEMDSAVTGLRENGRAIAAQEFFPAFVESMVQKKAALENLTGATMPHSEEELEALKDFGKKYDGLLEAIQRANGEFRVYLGKLSDRLSNSRS